MTQQPLHFNHHATQDRGIEVSFRTSASKTVFSDSDSTSFTSASFQTPSHERQPNREILIIDQRTSRRKLADLRISSVLTINKLKTQSIGLVGREKETLILRERLQPLIRQANGLEDEETAEGRRLSGGSSNSRDSSSRRSADSKSRKSGQSSVLTKGSGSADTSSSNCLPYSNTKKELVFIKGFSGVGKTSLARVISKEVNSTENGFFAEGKFDFAHSKDEPYSGISKAYSELIRELWREDRDALFRIGRVLCEILRTDVEPLTFLIPELEDVVSEYSTTSYSDGSMDGMQERWKYSFRVLTRLLTAHVKPLVIVIDDLQWADKASLDMIECLISDTQNVNPLMVIGCYRSNEVDEESDLIKSIEFLKGEKRRFGFDITEIALSGCGKPEVNQMIMNMMNADDEESTKDLADLCVQRTLGNPFFVIEFMMMLQREDLIKFSLGTMTWVYDVSRIEAETMSTANVVELLESRMKKMPADVQLLLLIAACIGPTFKVSILEMVWANLSFVESKGFDPQKVPVLIEFMAEEMLIEKSSGDNKYRWVHDKVQEAALSLVDVDEKALKFQMGTILFLNLSAKDLDDELFDVADLISCGKGRKKSPDFASLCLKAATKAMRLSAFLSSSRYIQNGIAMLPLDMWTSHQALTLELHTLGAQVELELGHAAESKKYCTEVFQQDNIDKAAKIPLKLVDIKRLSTVELKYADSIRNSLALLKDLKFKFRWNKTFMAVQVMTLLKRTIQDVLKQPKDFYVHLGRMDKHHSTICEVLGRISYASNHFTDIGSQLQMLLCMCHIVQLTLEHGLCQQSCTNIAFIGCFAIIIFGKNEDAPFFRDLALNAQSHFGRTFASQTLFGVYTYNLAWSLQLETIVGPLFQGYMHGMQNGEVDFAMHNLNGHSIQLPYCLGKPIDQILDECPKVVMQAEEVAQISQMKMMKSMWQMYIQLRNASDNNCMLKGDVHSIESCEGDELQLAWHNFAEFQLLFFYRHPTAADRAVRKKLTTASNFHFTLMIESFHRCICLYEAARRNKKQRRKYKRHAQKLRKVYHNWKQVGNPNVVYYCLFLDAQHAALEGKYLAAESFYKQAIQFVCRSGFLHHAALFNELYSDFLLEERKDPDEAKYRLEEAIRYYKEWGALGVVERLIGSPLMEYTSHSRRSSSSSELMKNEGVAI